MENKNRRLESVVKIFISRNIQEPYSGMPPYWSSGLLSKLNHGLASGIQVFSQNKRFQRSHSVREETDLESSGCGIVVDERSEQVGTDGHVRVTRTTTSAHKVQLGTTMVLPSGAKYLQELPDSVPIPPLPYYNKYWEPPSPFTPAPPTLEGWERRNDVSPATPVLLTELEALGYRISSVRMLGSGIFHMVYILTLDDGSEILSRISFNFKSDTPSHRLWAEKKMEREIAVLKLLDRNALVPGVVYASPSTDNLIASPYMLLQRLPGAPFGKEAHSITTMSEKAEYFKERLVASLAAAFVQVFEVSLIAIGTVVNVNPDGRPIVGPLVDVGETDHIVAEGKPSSNFLANILLTFNSRYLDAMITLAKVRNTLCPINRGPTAEDPDLPSLLNRLRALAGLLIPTDDATSPRIALVHSDANADNMLMHDGVISGLIDWEKSAALPTYLAARYPPFLRSDGIWDPRYAARSQAMYRYPSEWPVTEEERKHLRAVFQELPQSAGKLNIEFTRALEQGETLRQLVEWVEFSAWSGQTTWDGCDRWERDTRAALGRQSR
ncbi:hypothetical protein C8R47DRAFT_1069994 [Mycena vitilis]|nr:hypothetical protein C8R47DRAFT_1069994 [Mycena vitilis]